MKQEDERNNKEKKWTKRNRNKIYNRRKTISNSTRTHWRSRHSVYSTDGGDDGIPCNYSKCKATTARKGKERKEQKKKEEKKCYTSCAVCCVARKFIFASLRRCCVFGTDARIQMSGKIIKLLSMQRKLRNQIILFTAYGSSSASSSASSLSLLSFGYFDRLVRRRRSFSSLCSVGRINCMQLNKSYSQADSNGNEFSIFGFWKLFGVLHTYYDSAFNYCCLLLLLLLLVDGVAYATACTH